MRKTNNTIQINGKHYDAETGAPVNGTTKQTVKHAKSIDGVHKSSRSVPRHTGRKASPPHTLMRKSVKKPSASTQRKLKAQSQSEASSDIVTALPAVKTSVSSLDEHKLQHAKKIHKSRLITRFAPQEAKPEPVLYSQLADSKSRELAARQARATAKHPAKSKTTSDILELALQNASSHEEPEPPKASRRTKLKRTAGISGAIVLAIVVMGVITSQNLPNAKMQVASAKAGFDATLPQYKPAGYSLGKLDYSEGVVAVKFNSNSDNRSYTLTQKQSPWDSAALRDGFVKPIDPNYQAVESKGLTVYIYGNHNATWVNGGIWYQLQTDGSLSNRQVVDLATSL